MPVFRYGRSFFFSFLFFLTHTLGPLKLIQYRRFIAGSTHVSRILIKVEKLHSTRKRKKINFCYISATLHDHFQKNHLLFFELFSVGPTMNLRYTAYSSYCHLQFGFAQCNNVFLLTSIFTHESCMGCFDIIKHK